MTYVRDPYDTDQPPCVCDVDAGPVLTTEEFCPAHGDPAKPAPEPPDVREVGRVEGVYGVDVIVGVAGECITVNGCTLGREATEELAHLIVAASWEAGDHAGRVAGQL